MDGFPSGLIGGVAATAALPLIVWAVNRPRPGRPEFRVARFGAGMMAFLLLSTLLFGIPFVLMLADLLPGKDTDQWWVRAIFGGFAGLSLLCFLDGLVRRLAWSDGGIVARNWRGERRATWSEIDAIDYRPGMQFWRIALPGGGFGFSETMRGAHAFLEEAYRCGVTIMSNGEPIPGPNDQPPETQ